MRLYLRIGGNDQAIPFTYQEIITGAIHKWIGKNNQIHGKPAQYTFSWIANTIANRDRLTLKEDAYFFISAFDASLIKEIVKGILNDPTINDQIKVTDVQIQNAPDFSESEKFSMASPVLLKLREGDSVRHITHKDENFEDVLTSHSKIKLEKAGIDTKDFGIRLNPDTNYRKTKLVTYKGVENKTTLAPLIINGSPKQIKYLWSVGLGHSTGIGFGALK